MTTGAVWQDVDRERFLETIWRLQGDGTQRDLAEALGVAPSTITRVLSGQRSPGARLIMAMMNEFANCCWH